MLYLQLLLLFFGSFNAKPVVADRVGPKDQLINRKWYMQEIRAIQDNTVYYYKRNEPEKSNIDFDKDYIVFNEKGSGHYYQSDGQVYNIKWNYVEGKTDMVRFTVDKFRSNKPLEVTWENMELDNGVLKFTEYYTHVTGVNSLAYVIRMSGVE